MSNVTLSRFVSRLPKRVYSVDGELSVCSRFTVTVCQKKAQLPSPGFNVQRFQKRTCLKKTPSLIQTKRFFSASAYRFVHRSLMLQSSKTSRKSASVIATRPTEATELPDIGSSQLQQRYIYVHTSANRWEDVPGGLVFDTAYLDSMPGDKISAAVPLVVSLHSTPGSFFDMQPVVEAFIKSGCRVLAPAFPGGGYTEGILHGYNDVFTHSTSEKAEFVRDFLLALGVKKVDLLMGHGCGCYPAMRLTAGKDTSSMFKSTAFLSPWPHRDFKGTSQTNLLTLLHDMWDRPYYRPMAKALSRLVTNTSNIKPLERITLVNTLYNLDFGEVGGFGLALDALKFPRVMLFAEDDSYVDAELSYELADMMGIQSDCTYHFSGQLERGKMDQFPSCVVFDKGGKHVHLKHSGVVTAVLFNLLKSVRPGFLAV